MQSEKSNWSRRSVVGGLSAGMVAALGARANAAPAAMGSEEADPPVLPNPVTEYPHPPFERQTQEWPGLASRMIPPPDHGEASYRGSGRLIGRRALITGGDSGM